MAARRVRSESAHHADAFVLDLHKALVEQLPAALDALKPAALTPENLAVLGAERGVYQLFERGDSVYVGKSEEPLAARLDQHRRRCSGRWNTDLAEMSFRCLYVDAFVDAASPERLLIASYQRSGQAPWNNKAGFGPKDVGRKRDHGVPGQWFIDRPVVYETEIVLPNHGQRIPLVGALGQLQVGRAI